MSDVTIADFIAWEPRLAAGGARPAAGHRVPGDLGRPLAWVVAARAGIPMLPALRGGEAVLLPDRLLDALETPLAELLADLARSGVSAAILPVDRAPAWPSGAGPLVVLRTDAAGSGADIESELNRSLTELRGDLYRAGTDLSREVSRVASAGGAVEQLLAAASSTLDMDLTLGSAREIDGERWDAISLAVGPSVSVTATVADVRRRSLARLALRALQGPLSEALRRDEASRPRGAARASALGRLLDGDPGTSVDVASRTLGLDPSGRYRVVAVTGADPAVVARSIGNAEDAGSRDGLAALVVRADDDPLSAGKQAAALARLDRLAGTGAGIAVSDAVVGVAALPTAWEQATFVARLQARGFLHAEVVAFDTVDRIGPFRLVQAAMLDPDLARFTLQALGRLPAEDRRRTLRETLLAFLEAGGSQALTAERLGIHRNTLAYRLRRISELAGSDPADPANRLTLHMAALIDAVGADAGPAG